MRINRNTGFVEIFPAIPSSWRDISFRDLRTQGAFLISAKKENGIIDEIKVVSENGGLFRLKMPFKTFYITNTSKKYVLNKTENILEITMKPGESLIVKNGNE